MTALDTIIKISNTKLINYDFRFCLVTHDKKPIKLDGKLARPNREEDFVTLDDLLQCDKLTDYAGVGISVQASKVFAIDVDKCFSKKHDMATIDERGAKILDMFRNKTYCEYSFSGTGLRILFTGQCIEHYSDKYYVKNEREKLEFYQPSQSYRYVTLTGDVISDMPVEELDNSFILNFLNQYLLRPVVNKISTCAETSDSVSFEEMMIKVKKLYYTDMLFQNLWFAQAPGSGKNESELDYQLLAYLFENVTTQSDMLQRLFEASSYFKSKDEYHMRKWTYQNNRYFKYIYSQLRRTHGLC